MRTVFCKIDRDCNSFQNAGKPLFGTLIALLHKGKPVCDFLSHRSLYPFWHDVKSCVKPKSHTILVRHCQKIVASRGIIYVSLQIEQPYQGVPVGFLWVFFYPPLAFFHFIPFFGRWGDWLVGYWQGAKMRFPLYRPSKSA